MKNLTSRKIKKDSKQTLKYVACKLLSNPKRSLIFQQLADVKGFVFNFLFYFCQLSDEIATFPALIRTKTFYGH